MEKQKKITIIGLGYVGLPLSIAFSDFYQLCGFDVNSTRISEFNQLRKGKLVLLNLKGIYEKSTWKF